MLGMLRLLQALRAGVGALRVRAPCARGASGYRSSVCRSGLGQGLGQWALSLTRDHMLRSHPPARPSPPQSEPTRIVRWARGSGSSILEVQCLLEEYKRLAKLFTSE